MSAIKESPRFSGSQPFAKGVAMGHQNPSTITEKVRADQGEEESLMQLEFSIVITALVALFITLGYFIYNNL